jgi:hypothetical protein
LSNILHKSSNQGCAPIPAPPIVHQVLQNPGHPLDNATRAFFEPKFGHDFSNVRVYTGTKADESARAVNAFAYTFGQNVVFGKDMYNPQSRNGMRLLEHELSHVADQSKRNNSSEKVLYRAKNPVAEKTPYQRPDKNRFNLCFIMGKDDGFYKAGEWFARAYYSGTHEIIPALSLSSILEEIQSRVEYPIVNEKRNKLGQVIIISHANEMGMIDFPINDTDENLWFYPDDLSKLLSKDWLEKINVVTKFGKNAAVRASDEQTQVIIKGCNLGQSQAALTALRELFGGKPTVSAPKHLINFTTLGYGPSVQSRRTPGEVISWMVNNGYLPPEANLWTNDKKQKFVDELFPRSRNKTDLKGIPAEFLIINHKYIPPSDPLYWQEIEVSKPNVPPTE